MSQDFFMYIHSMKNVLYLLLILTCTADLSAQYFQQEASYEIDVTVDDQTKSIEASSILTYTNHSEDDLDELYFHLWANAFSSKESDYAKQLRLLTTQEFLSARPDKMGGYVDVTFSINGVPLTQTNVDYTGEIVSVKLPSPLSPEKTVHITCDYQIKLPYLFSRMGWQKNFISLTQWFPKVAVYDTEGWHTMPYLEFGEYYADFGDYKVTLHVPGEYVVGYTGTITSGDNKSSNETEKTLVMEAENVVDFALFMSPDIEAKERKIEIDGKEIILYNYTQNASAYSSVWAESLDYTERALRFYSEQIGTYPYPQVSVVESFDSGGGMEYPMITLLGGSSKRSLDEVITHELGHNWFQAVLATDERDYPWMDEGMNTYYTNKYVEQNYKGVNLNQTLERVGTSLLDANHSLPPVESDSQKWSDIAYLMNSYSIFSRNMSYLESIIGTEEMNANMRKYWDEWAFKHPSPEAFRSVFEEDCKGCLNWFFDKMLKQGIDSKYLISATSPTDLKVHDINHSGFPTTLSLIKDKKVIEEVLVPPASGWQAVNITSDDYDYAEVDRHNYKALDFKNRYHRITKNEKGKPIDPLYNVHKRLRNYFYPAIGINSTDGFLLGVGLSNWTPILKDLEYTVTPFYGFGSKSLSGEGQVNYTNYAPKKSPIQYTTYGLEMRRYGFFKQTRDDYHLSYTQVRPNITLGLKQEDAYKSTNLIEISVPVVFYQNANYDTTGVYSGKNTEMNYGGSVHWTNISSDNYNPTKLKIGLVYNNFENYAKRDYAAHLDAEIKSKIHFAQKGRLHMRLYGGFMLANSQKDIISYSPGDLGLFFQSYNDVTYDGYFLDRSNRWDNFAGSQVSIAQGGFKNALGSANASSLGNSKKYILAANFALDIPFLPSYLPIKPYIDLGYFGTKDRGPNAVVKNFQYSGGLELLLLDGVLGIYWSAFNSEDINRIYDDPSSRTTRFSFSLDLQRIMLSTWGRSLKNSGQLKTFIF